MKYIQNEKYRVVVQTSGENKFGAFFGKLKWGQNEEITRGDLNRWKIIQVQEHKNGLKKDAAKMIWSAYRRYRLGIWLKRKVLERQNKKSVFDADIIYIINVTIRRILNLDALDGNVSGFVEIKCGDKTFRSASIKNTSNSEWNESMNLHFWKKPEKISFAVIRETDHFIIGCSDMLLQYFSFDCGNQGIIYYPPL